MRKILRKIQKTEINSFIDAFVKERQKFFTPGQEWLESELADEKIYIPANTAQLENELDKLIKNSLENGSVFPLEMKIKVEKTAEGAKICYSDNGAGIWRNKSFLLRGQILLPLRLWLIIRCSEDH